MSQISPLRSSSKNLYHDANLNVDIHPVHLSFSDLQLEIKFNEKFNKDNIISTRFGFVLAIILFTVYGLIDIYTQPEDYTKLWLVRAIVDIVVLGAYFYTYSPNYLKNSQRINTFIGIFVGIHLIYLYTFSSETHFIYLFTASYALLIIGIFVTLGLRFINALASIGALHVLMSIVIIGMYDLTDIFQFAMLFLSTTLLVAVAAYFSEINRRLLFLKETYTIQLLESLNEAQEQLKEQANRDPLTELYNRRYFTSISKNLVEISKRNQTPLSVIMIDIDRFKRINDNYGHDIGDHVIIHLASKLMEHTRGSDIVFRFGGEEFAILLPGIEKKAACKLAEKLREIIQESSLKETDILEAIHFTISLGVSSLDKADTSMENTLKKADRALYNAKENGRNRVESN